MEEYIIKSVKNKNNMKLYKCHDPIGPGVTVRAPERCCLFCKHCSDVYWDYTNGPYMMICSADHEETLGYHAKCEYFEEDEKWYLQFN